MILAPPPVAGAPYGRHLPISSSSSSSSSSPSGHLPRGQGSLGRRSIQSFFVSEALRQDLAKRTCALYSADPDLDRPTPAPPQVTPPPKSHPESVVVPGAEMATGGAGMGRMGGCHICGVWRVRARPPVLQVVGVYHSLQLLEAPLRERTGRVLGYATTVFRATSSMDGAAYALRYGSLAMPRGSWWWLVLLVADPRTDRCRCAMTATATTLPPPPWALTTTHLIGCAAGG